MQSRVIVSLRDFSTVEQMEKSEGGQDRWHVSLAQHSEPASEESLDSSPARQSFIDMVPLPPPPVPPPTPTPVPPSSASVPEELHLM